MRSITAALLVLATACGGSVTPAGTEAAPAPASLVGTWTGESQNAAGTSFIFRADGTASWMLSRPFEIRYLTDLTSRPATLDLFGFEGTPLDGRTLKCILELAGDQMRMDCEPDRYPATFSATQTQTFVRRP